MSINQEFSKTKDYSIFKEFSSNREVDEKHVKRLMKSISSRNLLHVNPIVCDDQLQVIDGQHRLEAAKRLNLDIYYISNSVIRKDISMLNSNQKNWTAMDYINFFTVEKVPSFMQFSHLINKYPKMAVSSLLSLCNSLGRRDLNELKRGDLDIQNIDKCILVCELCVKLNHEFEYDFVWDSRFPIALARIVACENYKEEILLEKIKTNPRAFVKCHTADQYVNMIQEVYNYVLSKNKIKV